MAKRRIVRNSVFSESVNNSNFINTPSTTIFRLGNFTLDTNLEDRKIGDFSNRISSFSKEYTLESIGINETISEKIYKNDNKIKLNLDFNEITSYSRYGSVEDLIKFTVKNIIEKFPYSLRVVNQLNTGLINTIYNFSYNELENISTFKIPTISIINISNIIVDSENNVPNEENRLKNFNLSYNDYVIWDFDNKIEYPIISFNGNLIQDTYIILSVKGRLFNLTNSTLSKTFHIKPSSNEFSKFIYDLNDIEKYFLNNKNNDGFVFKLKDIKEDGRSFYTRNYIWPTSDNYNIDIDTVSYNVFINNLIFLGKKYDEYKTDTIYRFYTTDSLKEFDVTNSQKIKKLIRTYGFEFDKIRRLADGFATLNNLSYKKEKSVPDILVKNLAKTLGWEVFDIVKEDDLLNKIFYVGTSDISKSTIPSEIDIELWRRILINTKWFLKSKGTRKSLETIFKMIGIPDDFILLNEYIYLAENKLELNDRLPSINQNQIFNEFEIINTPSYNDEGYPIAVPETTDFFFQISGNTDSGQTYINRFRENGFIIDDIVDNKKSWTISKENILRFDKNTFYELNDTELLINTKEIDIGISISQAIESNIFNTNKLLNYPICSSGVTTNVLYMNTSFVPNQETQNVFDIPDVPEGDINVSVNGITLTINEDYIISGTSNNRIVLNEPVFNQLNGLKDIITITYVTDLISETRNLVEYVVVKIGITENNQTIINLTDEPLGDVQIVLNGITLTQGKTSSDGDYVINPNNRTEIIITAQNINNFIKQTDKLVVMYLKEVNDNSLYKYTDTYKITSFYNNKLYFNNIINKYTFITDYKILRLSDIKLTLNGIILNNGVDFILDPINKNKIVFSSQIVLNINDVISVYYILDSDVTDNCVDLDLNIQNSTFTEYIDAVLTNLIDVKNRKIITDNNGGLYPKLSYLYDNYVKSINNSQSLTVYKFSNLYEFIKKFDDYFFKFLDQLLPATTIIRKSGVIVSNTIFSRQKYKYIRGINDGSEFVGNNEKLICDLFDFTTIKSDAKTSENLGSIIINPTGFNGFVEYSIDGGEFFFFDNEFIDLQPGEYNIVLKDEIGCSVSGSTTIEVDCTDFQLNTIIVDNVKSDTELGSIQLIASGDSFIEYSINGGQTFTTNNIFNNLVEGEYNIVVRNSLDCTITDTTIIGIDCDLSITDLTFGVCEATGFLNRDGSSLTVVNNVLALFMNYNFEIDSEYSRYFREKITITETTTSHVLLEKWVDFVVEPNSTFEELGNIFIYQVPTYQTFNFTVSYSDQVISCTPITEPLPEDNFIPLPDEPEITFELEAVRMGEDYLGSGTYDIILGAKISNPLSQDLIVTVSLSVNDDGTETTLDSQITIPQGFTSIQTVSGNYTNSTSNDDTIFGPICVFDFTYIGSETITIINPC